MTLSTPRRLDPPLPRRATRRRGAVSGSSSDRTVNSPRHPTRRRNREGGRLEGRQPVSHATRPLGEGRSRSLVPVGVGGACQGARSASAPTGARGRRGRREPQHAPQIPANRTRVMTAEVQRPRRETSSSRTSGRAQAHTASARIMIARSPLPSGCFVTRARWPGGVRPPLPWPQAAPERPCEPSAPGVPSAVQRSVAGGWPPPPDQSGAIRRVEGALEIPGKKLGAQEVERVSGRHHPHVAELSHCAYLPPAAYFCPGNTQPRCQKGREQRRMMSPPSTVVSAPLA